ncbi:response regulator [Castellaniella sp.]|uniref:response regulator n=1 Tax=Castellaniella sp. TaxID=1955812 RepID=UPI0035612666
MSRILVVEDEPKLAEVLRTYLEAAGHEVHLVNDGLQAMAAFEQWQPALVLLDLMLPGRDGLDICRDIRARSAVPVIMVTARSEEIDRLLGLELGADDYICKPFSPREVVARVRAVLRRTEEGASGSSPPAGRARATRADASCPSPGPSSAGPIAAGSRAAWPAVDTGAPSLARASALQVDVAGWQASLDGHVLDLTPVEFRLLNLLASQPGRIFSRDQVLDGLYDDHRVVTDRAVDTHVKNLRRKLAAVRPGQDLIRTVYGVGYRLTL